jgi:hypothetical protein
MVAGEKTRSERREAKRQNARKMRVSGRGIWRTYRDAILKHWKKR